MKTCTKCQQSKPLTEYQAIKTRPCGYKSICKKCLSIYAKENKESYLESSRKNVKKSVDELRDSYIISKLKKQNLPITKETIELKRLSILTTRLCKATSKN